MSAVFHFDAAISYNRADTAFADQLEHAVEHWSVPKSVTQALLESLADCLFPVL